MHETYALWLRHSNKIANLSLDVVAAKQKQQCREFRFHNAINKNAIKIIYSASHGTIVHTNAHSTQIGTH